MYSLFPGLVSAASLFGYQENYLINVNRTVQDDRGAGFLYVDPSKYQGTEPMHI